MPEPDPLTIVRLPQDGLTDPATIEHLLRLLEGDDGPTHLHIDFSDVQDVPSMGLVRLVALHRAAKRRGGSLALVNVPGPACDLLRLTNLHTVLDVREKAAG